MSISSDSEHDVPPLQQPNGSVRLEVPTIGCIPVRPFLIILSILGIAGSFWAFIGVMVLNETMFSSYLKCFIGLCFHTAVLIGTINYYDDVLYVCQRLTLISMILSVFLVIVVLASNLKIEQVIELQLLIAFSIFVTALEYVSIERLRKYIEARRGTGGNESLA
ncbi:Protein CBG27231 [Caenorhabditis briggsae]|uniref:Protein CBG27231 n=1 Tax=Caenorhabditis briggsae TaxID=6238 RepID=B6IFV4_CAEBR|nr:Protein CBG27231 [Caenorhabditis briggsae]CAR98770.1 Protein CBG27231 [Caenorhabditis briggsae]